MELSEGQVLGDFRIISLLGVGGMGEVYKAIQIHLNRKVAIKVISDKNITDPKTLMRFKREVQIVSQLHHKNIVEIYGVWDEDNIHYFAMELLEGSNLAQYLRDLKCGEVFQNKAVIIEIDRDSTMTNQDLKDLKINEEIQQYDQIEIPSFEKIKKPELLEIKKIVKLIIEVGEGLAFAHLHGVIHRDIKPSNIILDKEGVPHLTDFGLARSKEDMSLTKTQVFLGTPRYMCPEYLMGENHPQLDTTIDIYSLGATLYELVCLSPPFKGNNISALITQMKFFEPDQPKKLNQNIPEILERIILKAIEKKPEDRYQNVDQLVNDLTAFLSNKPSSVETTKWLQKNKKLFLKYRVIILSTSVILITMFLLFLGAPTFASIFILGLGILSLVYPVTNYLRAKKIYQREREQEIREQLLKAWTFYKTKHYSEAIQNFGTVLDQNPSCQEALQGFKEAQIGKRNEIQRLFQEGKAFYEEGEFILAAERLTEASIKDKDNKDLQIWLKKARGLSQLTVTCSYDNMHYKLFQYNSSKYQVEKHASYEGLLPIENLELSPGDYLLVLYREDLGFSEFWLEVKREEKIKKHITQVTKESEIIKDMVKIPEGYFLMGAKEDDADVFDDEKPQFKLFIPEFYIDQNPVTNQEYKRFIDVTDYHFPTHKNPEMQAIFGWKNGTYPPGMEDHPVVCVNWFDCMAYAEWVGKRLPTEAEWEKASRGLEGWKYPWGNEFDLKKCNCRETGILKTTPIGNYLEGRSPYGLNDAIGNVWEWTFDLFHYYGKKQLTNDRVIRGGSYKELNHLLRCTLRRVQPPSMILGTCGFRLVRSSLKNTILTDKPDCR